MPNKELIYTDKRRFQADLVKHDAFLQLILESITFISEEAKLELTAEELTRENAFNLYMQKFAKKHAKVNLMELSGVRLHDLMEIDLARIIGIFDKLKVNRHQVKPDITDYSTYAETEEELRRLKISLDFLDIMKQIESSITFSNPYRAPIRLNVYDRISLEPNVSWIKQTARG